MPTNTCLTSRPGTPGSLPYLGAVLWIFCLGIGFYYLVEEQFTPIKNSTPPSSYPQFSTVHPNAQKPVLILFAHPFCPCSRASLHELQQLMAETGDRISLRIVFTIPDGLEKWEKSDLIQIAKNIPGAKIVLDQGGKESSRFGVQGSGEALLYDLTGKLRFHGGITPSRGHEGENVGRSTITGFVLRGTPPIAQTPAFGCSLL